jgi:signal transduction histidine kinase
VIRLLLFDKKRNVLWAGTHYNGLNRIDLSTGKITKFLTDPNDDQSFPHHRVRALYLDKQNRLWIGSGDGMALFDDATQSFKRVKKYSSDEATTDVRGIFQTDDNTIWSSSGYGLNRININTLQVEKKYLEKDGLTRSSIYSIIDDERGNFWMPTIRGLTQFNPKERSFNRFFLGHNLQSNEFNFNASFKEKDGSIIVGGVGGITRFNPSEVNTDVSNYSPVVLGIKSVDNNLQERQVLGVTAQTTSSENSFSLASNQRSVIIDFTIPEYIFAEDLKYEYHLQGDKDQWLPATPRDTPIRYTNLDAGKHAFQVRKASANNKQYEPLTINFTIDKYYWEEYWFLALMLATLALASFYLFRSFSAYRLEKQISQERSQLYSMVVHDLGPALNRSQGDIKTLRNIHNDQQPELKELLNDLESDNQYSLSFINQLRSLSTVEGFYEKKKDSFLLEDIVDESINNFRANKSRLVVKDAPDCTVLAYENSIEFIIKNLISNALKYSEPDTSVTVELIQVDNNSIMISVIDQGIGISETFKKSVFKPYERGDYYKTEGLGIGLTLIKNITQKYQGDIAIKNNQPQGTIMQVTLRDVVVAE